MNYLCPTCGSDSLTIHVEQYDGGIDGDSGYHDVGESATWRCNACNAVGDDVEGDLVVPVEELVTV